MVWRLLLAGGGDGEGEGDNFGVVVGRRLGSGSVDVRAPLKGEGGCKVLSQ